MFRLERFFSSKRSGTAEDGRKSDFCTVPSSVFRPLRSDSTSTFGRVKSNYLEELFRDPKRIGRQTKLLLVIQNLVLAQFMTPDL